MYYSIPSVAQHSWSGIPGAPCIFSPSPTSSIQSRCPPQILLDPRNPTPTSFDEGRIRRSQEFYAPPRPSVSAPPGRGDLWDAFNLSQLFSVNAGPPPPPSGGQTRSRQQQQQQQFLFGGTHSPLAFDVDNFWPTPPADENHIPSPITPASLPDPLPPLPPPPPPTDQIPFSQNVPAGDHLSLAWLNRLEPVSTPSGPYPQGGPQVTAARPKRPHIQRSSSRPSKKRKDGRADGKDEPTLLQCCLMVKPESLARHQKSDGHKRNAGLPLDRPESCSICNIAFARQDARNRHFRSQHQRRLGGDPPPEDQKVYKPKRPSATHPSLLPKTRK